MPHITNPTISGVTNMGSIIIKDDIDGTEANVTQAGLAVDVSNPIKIGHTAYQIIDASYRTLDTTTLLNSSDYPMVLELEAQYAPCYLYQGPSTVTLPAGHLKRLCMDEWEVVTVSGVDEAYFALVRESSSTASGLLVATRIDRKGR